MLCALTHVRRPHLPATSHAYVPTNGNARRFKLHHSNEGGFDVNFVQHSRGGLPSPPYLPPLRHMIRQPCCAQIELSERLPFSPPFHVKNTQTVGQSDTHKMEIVSEKGEGGGGGNFESMPGEKKISV